MPRPAVKVPTLILMLRKQGNQQEHHYARLAYAILDSALTDLYHGWTHWNDSSYQIQGNRSFRKYYNDAKYWFTSTATDPLSLTGICRVTGLDKEKLLRQIRAEGWFEIPQGGGGKCHG